MLVTRSKIYDILLGIHVEVKFSSNGFGCRVSVVGHRLVLTFGNAKKKKVRKENRAQL